MTEKSELIPYLAIWAAAMFLVLWRTWKSPGAGLMLAYCFQMLMLYWVGAAVHVFPWSDLPETDLVFLGFEQSTYAVVAFAVGALALGPLLVKGISARHHERTLPDLRLPRAYIIYGICSYFVLAPTLGSLKGFSAISSVGAQLVVVGCCLNCWKAWQSGGKSALVRALGPTMIIPCVTIVVQGFLGYGVMALSIIMIFCAQFFRPRWILVLGFVVSCYIGLSVYTSYMKGRNELRSAVWDDDATLSDKLDKFTGLLENAEWFDPTNSDHLELIDTRLNQNALVGAAVSYLGNTDEFAKGDTLWEAVIGMVPRLIWHDKPIEAGSGGLATRFTGIDFAAGTSVGVGPVLELYANFGTAAVVIGFLLLGIVIKVIDVMAGLHLIWGDWYGFGAYCLVGISFLNVSGSFVETSMGAMASLVLAKFVNRVLKRANKTTPPVPLDRDAKWAEA